MTFFPGFQFRLILLSLGGFTMLGTAFSIPSAADQARPAIHHGLRADALARLENYVSDLDRRETAPIVLAADDTLLEESGDTLLNSPDDTAASDSDNLLPGDDSGDLLAAPAESGDDLLTSDDSGGDDLLSGGNESGDDLLNADGGGDDLLQPSDEDNLLLPGGGLETAEENKKKEPAIRQQAANEAHENLFIESKYPSANTCATCHPRQYEQWSASQHAYAQLSPVYMAMQTAINIKTSATNGDFCIRCHNPVGMNLGESLYVTNLDRPPTSREGITCVACHRVNKNYGKISGRFALEQGDIFSSVYGPSGNQELSRVLNHPEEYRVSKSKDDPGRSIHTQAKRFFTLTKPSFCGTCHDVTLLNGFRLEEAFAEYKQTPAAKRGETCQDCHMGKIQGVASGYDYGPAAVVGDVPTKNRKLTNHAFAGPDYSIIHPGIFPHNVEAAEFKTLREWLQFRYWEGWGTDKFEDAVSDSYKFPKAWQSVDDRYDARAILKVQFERLGKMRALREQVLRNGFKLSDISILRSDRNGLKFSVDVRNGTDGHAVPTGFDAERLIFLKVEVRDRHGKIVYVSGDRDPNGDVRDSHSLYVHNGELPLDKDLFSLQSKFLVRMLRGGEREQVLAINTSTDVLPFVRPETRATTIYGRPRGARKHKQTIEPNASRTATYNIPPDRLKPGETYSISVSLISQMVPVNLIAAIQGAGFDYGMSPAQIARQIVRGSSVLWTRRSKVRID
ncbi:multiheme c-type cytochrome [uncultured Roseibium sp.]|uniref:multiheme c-type cytochrome n=1 Tax=uncultured Roseibium sp. TaxID=1936171 RepID=UPI003216B154